MPRPICLKGPAPRAEKSVVTLHALHVEPTCNVTRVTSHQSVNACLRMCVCRQGSQTPCTRAYPSRPDFSPSPRIITDTSVLSAPVSPLSLSLLCSLTVTVTLGLTILFLFRIACFLLDTVCRLQAPHCTWEVILCRILPLSYPHPSR